MEKIHKLPFLLGGFMAVVAGFISYIFGSGNQATYIRMSIVMVIFYIIGVFIKNTLKTIRKELNEKKEQEEILLDEKQSAIKDSMVENPSGQHPAQYKHENNINLVADDSADDSNDEFSPLVLSRLISKSDDQ